MAAKKKVKKEDPHAGVVTDALKLLLQARDACDHMDKELSPTARISWRERALAKTAVARGMLELVRLLKEK